MTQIDSHVAQLNVALLNHPHDDPRTAGFADNTARVNALAERSEGFVWRCVDEKAQMAAEAISLFDGDECATFTLSVWLTPDHLEKFVHKTIHGAFLKRRAEWFRALPQKTYAIWPIPAGTLPTLKDGLDRIARLEAEGPSEAVYDFKYLQSKRH